MAPPPCLSSSPLSPSHPPASQSLPTSAAGLESNVTILTHLSLLQLLCHFCSWTPATSTARAAPLTDPTETSISIDSGEYRSSSHRRGHSRLKICAAKCQRRSRICTWLAVDRMEDLRSSHGRGWAQAQISDMCHQMICERDDDQSRPSEMHQMTSHARGDLRPPEMHQMTSHERRDLRPPEMH
ncbi:Uncharacterized protein Fot_13023 [Forsythia ovata]|uniref:Uncharacterized protein n=1 Tax=Forsythia ovata TaxID=205694 RepID=A0ABD1W2T2_9LAMI